MPWGIGENGRSKAFCQRGNLSISALFLGENGRKTGNERKFQNNFIPFLSLIHVHFNSLDSHLAAQSSLITILNNDHFRRISCFLICHEGMPPYVCIRFNAEPV
jgi:hypothetical protein